MTHLKSHIIGAISVQNGFIHNNSKDIVEKILILIKSKPESVEDIRISGVGKFLTKGDVVVGTAF